MVSDSYSFVMLFMGLLLNVAGLVLGILLALRAGDNRLKLFWGTLVAICSLSMLIDNLRWMERFMLDYGMEERSSLLIIGRMFKWYLFVHVLTLFPVASLRPGWLTPLRTIIFSLPLIFSSLVVLCYLWFNGEITPLFSVDDIFRNLDRLDVRLRLSYFLLSVVLPLVCFLIPFMGRWFTIRRSLTAGMYLYIVSSVFMLVLYVLFILDTTEIIFSLYTVMVALLPSLFAALYLRMENPLSSPRSTEEIERREETVPEADRTVVSPSVYRLYEKMSVFVASNTPYINPDYTLRQMASDLGTSQSLLSKAIQYRGFSGFSEYVNYLRLEYFKRLAVSSPGASVKELMFQCGFTSRSSFYRRFSEKEKMSPREYIEKLLSDV